MYGITINGANIQNNNVLGIKKEISIKNQNYNLNSNNVFNILMLYDKNVYRCYHNGYNMNNHNISINDNSVKLSWVNSIPNYPNKPYIYTEWG